MKGLWWEPSDCNRTDCNHLLLYWNGIADYSCLSYRCNCRGRSSGTTWGATYCRPSDLFLVCYRFRSYSPGVHQFLRGRWYRQLASVENCNGRMESGKRVVYYSHSGCYQPHCSSNVGRQFGAGNLPCNIYCDDSDDCFQCGVRAILFQETQYSGNLSLCSVLCSADAAASISRLYRDSYVHCPYLYCLWYQKQTGSNPRV